MHRKNLDLLKNLSSQILKRKEPTEVIQDSLDEAVTTFGFVGGLLLLIQDGELFVASIAGGSRASAFLNLIKTPISELRTSLDQTDNLIVRSINTRKPQHAYSLAGFSKSVLNPAVSKTAELITGTKASISIPLIYEDEVLGAIFFASGEKTDFQDVQDELEVVANFFAIAITNSQLYSQLKLRNDLLKKINENLKSSLTSITDMRAKEKEEIEILLHDLKSPITALGISLRSPSLKKLNQDFKEFDKLADMSLNHIHSILESFDIMVKDRFYTEELDIETFDLRDLFSKISDTYTMILESNPNLNLKLDIKNGNQNYVIKSDPKKITTILDNLIDNSIKYTDSGSITLSLKAGQDELIVCVSDTGIGIDNSELDKLAFKNYRGESLSKKLSGKPLPEGSGLGLYIVSQFLNLLGGTLDISAQPNSGTKVCFTLPREI